jgi:hypothetical protein
MTETLHMPDKASVDRCTTCNADLPHGYTTCDETLGIYCGECWPAVRCEELHGEGCFSRCFKQSGNE